MNNFNIIRTKDARDFLQDDLMDVEGIEEELKAQDINLDYTLDHVLVFHRQVEGVPRFDYTLLCREFDEHTLKWGKEDAKKYASEDLTDVLLQYYVDCTKPYTIICEPTLQKMIEPLTAELPAVFQKPRIYDTPNLK